MMTVKNQNKIFMHSNYSRSAHVWPDSHPMRRRMIIVSLDDARLSLGMDPGLSALVPGTIPDPISSSRRARDVILSAHAWTPAYNWKNIDELLPSAKSLANVGQAAGNDALAFFIVFKDRLPTRIIATSDGRYFYTGKCQVSSSTRTITKIIFIGWKQECTKDI